MLNRKIDTVIERHYTTEKKPLFLTGARQVGKDYERHNALTNVMNNTEYGIENAIVLCNDNLREVGKVMYAPIYMLMFIQKQSKPTSLIYSPDLTKLV